MNLNLDPKRVESVLSDTLSQVFAEMAFLDAVPFPEGAPPSTPETAMERIAVDVLKPVSIRIELRFTPALKKKVIDTLFDGTEKREGDDSLLEILNVTAGNFIIGYFGPATETKLELPEYLYFEESPDSTLVARARLLVEGEPLTANVLSVRYRY